MPRSTVTMLLVGLGLAAAPRAAQACDCVCSAPQQWASIALVNDGPLPRDGVLVFSGQTDSDLCLDDLAPFLAVEVRRGGALVDGALDLVTGYPNTFVWRPTAPWQPGAGYSVHAALDNPGLDSSPESIMCVFPVDCPDEVLAVDAAFEVADVFSPPPPPLPAPLLAIAVRSFDATAMTLACCPGVEPSIACTSGCACSISGGAGECAYLFEEHRLDIEVPAHTVPALLSHQLRYELRADGEVLDRQLVAEDLFKFRTRRDPACVQLLATHMGNGETITSTLVCTPEALASQLGVRSVDILAALNCPDPVRCGVGSVEWDPKTCAPYDPATSPPPKPVPEDIPYAPPCAALQGPWVIEPVGDDSATSTTAGESAEDACTCTQAARLPPLSLLLSLPLLFGRRRRARATRSP